MIHLILFLMCCRILFKTVNVQEEIFSVFVGLNGSSFSANRLKDLVSSIYNNNGIENFRKKKRLIW